MEAGSDGGVPRLEVFSQTETSEEKIQWLEEKGSAAIPLVLLVPGTEAPVLAELDMVEATLISDETITEVHAEFLYDPTPTDVITFHHGEILISEETASREASNYGMSVDEELLLYLIHGLLHLHGHTDLEEEERIVMHRHQEDVLSQVLGGHARNRKGKPKV